MEHKIVLGGNQWIPFARSRIKALRATGLSYAAQKFELNGATIRVWIKGEHDYIQIFDSPCMVELDSGIVEIWGIAEFDPTSFDAGILHDTLATLAYTSGFIGTPPDGRRTFPSSSNTGQIAGRLRRPSNFRGDVPFDLQPAASFRPGRFEDTGVVPPIWVEQPSDAALYLKKVTALNCPASIFTGRCRLYVQSMYGRPLYSHSYGLDGHPDDAGVLNPAPSPKTIIGNAPPELTIVSYRHRGDTTDYPSVDLTTSSGVHLDPLTGKHWLLNPSSSVVEIYPLVGNPCAELMRKYLKTGNQGAMTDVDLEHLEAHILSTCLPDAKNKQQITIAALTAGWAMGYGWHWNWTGLIADIVVNAQVSQGGANYGMRSTHYRLTCSLTTEGDWSASVSVLEGPTDWQATRTYWCIAEPDWGTGNLAKTTPATTAQAACDAPFYCFYLRDDLQVCRIKVELKSSVPASREITNWFGSTTPGGSLTYQTVGLENGHYKDLNASATYYSATVTCGSHSISGIDVNWGQTGVSVAVTNKVHNDVFSDGFGEDVFIGSQAIEHGTFPDYSNFSFFGSSATGSIGQVNWDTIQLNESESTYGQVAVVVPFYDAEAIFLNSGFYWRSEPSGIKKSFEHFDETSGVWAANDVWIEKRTAYVRHPTTYALLDTIDFFRYHIRAGFPEGALGNLLSTENPYIPDPEVTTDESAVLICRAGLIESVLFASPLSDFFNNAMESIAGNFATFSGASEVSPVVISTNRIDPIGLNGTLPDAPVLVGWI